MEPPCGQAESVMHNATPSNSGPPGKDDEGGNRLSLETGEFRLLTVYPSSDSSSDIECALSVAQYESAKYDALSYVWGDPGVTKPIRVNGNVKFVTTNLESALRRLRDATSDLIIWIDALCINQEDIEERNSQVQQMGQIFRHADGVLAWLGESADDSRLAFDKLRQWGEILLDHVRVSPSLRRKLMLPKSFVDAEMEGIVRSLDGISEEKVWAALVKLARRPWWTRAWILQECVLARRVTLLCGEDTLSWEYLISSGLAFWASVILRKRTTKNVCTSHATTHAFIKEFSQLEVGALYKCRFLYQIQRTHSRTAWLGTLLRASLREATEPRDRIFSVLGLCPDIEPPLLEVDYSKSLTQLCTTLSRALLALPPEQDRKIDGLNETPGTLANAVLGEKNWSRPDAPENLPTWANDWSFSEYGRCQPLVHSKTFRAAGRFTKDPVQFLSSDRMLVQGTVLDIVSTAMDADDTFVGQLCKSKKVWSMANLHAEDLYPNGITRLEALFRTIMQDVTPNGRRLHDEPQSAYTYIACFLYQMAVEAQAWNIRTARAVHARPVLKAICFKRTACGLGPFFSECSKGLPSWPARLDIIDATQRGADFQVLALRRRLFFSTDKGYMGTTDGLARTGDLVCVLHGGNVPYILRRIEQGYIIVGAAYVHGFMDGEAIDAVDAGLLTQQDFIIH